jgi:predicted nuclease with RNAse H fold
LSNSDCIIGIDFGAQLAGTTCCAVKHIATNTVTILTSTKGKSADLFIYDSVKKFKPILVGIDAPLSLPLFYTNPQQYSDNNFRYCDRELSAMSPMFLGGLTSRAMKIRYELEQQNIQCIEVYPKAFVKKHSLDLLGYKESKEYIPNCIEAVKKIVNVSVKDPLSTWHMFDSLVAVAITEHYYAKNADSVGNEEGYIYF